MTYPDELIYFFELSKTPIKFLSSSEAILRVKYATSAVNEIRRLRAKVNRLIRVHNEQDAAGNHIREHYAATEDLILEEEI